MSWGQNYFVSTDWQEILPPKMTKNQIVFDSSDHIRFQNGQDFSGHNYNCHRRITIEKNIEDAEGIHCNNIQYG